MKFSVAIASFVLLPCSLALNQVFELHGSGTSNPSKCYWSIMETLKEQADVPLHMTYRAVGSTQGFTEFTAQFSDPNITPKFGSGDVPVPQSNYNQINDGGASKMFHLPVLIGAISFFHSVPGYDDLKLNACIISQIYQLEITKWGDEAIVRLNPDMPKKARETPIIVGHRVSGSSSTKSSTEWMNQQCDNESQRLPDELVSTLPQWKTSGNTRSCSKSAGMTSCIQDGVGVIGYIDAGHGQSAGLSEVLLVAKGSFSRSSKELIQSAVALSKLPTSPDGDFSSVSFVTDGTDGWPIVNLTYLYVRKVIADYISDATEQGVFIAFLRALFNPDYVNLCAEEYGFVLPSNDIVAYANTAINEVASNVSEFFFEPEEQTIEAAKRINVFSTHRSEIADIERAALVGDVEEIEVTLSTVMDDIAALRQEIASLTTKNTELQQEVSSVERSGPGRFGSQEESNLKGAVALSVVSFILWVLWLVYFVYQRVCGAPKGHRTMEGVDANGGLELKNDRFVQDETSRI